MAVKILVIEDQQSVRENIEELLEIKGFEVVSAGNAVDGLLKIDTYIPDLVITDLMLPDFSGIEFIEKLRLIDGYSEIPVIIITGNDKPETFRSSMTQGADDYLSKPFKAQELYDSISSQLHKKEVRKENIELIAELSQQSPLPIIRINQFGKLIYSNPAANEIQCKNFIEKIFERIISHDAMHFNFEFLYEHQLYKVVVTYNNIQGYYNIYFLDITAENNKNIELSKKNELILLKNDNLIQFAYIVSHDLKAPIINLRQLTNLIKSEAVDKLGETSSGEPLLTLFEQSLAKIENVMNDLQKILNARDDKSLSVSEVFIIRNQIEKLADLFKNEQNIKHEALFIDIDQKYKLYFPISSFNTLIKNILEDSLRYNENHNSLKIEFKYTESEDDQILEMINHCSLNSGKPAQLNSSILYNPSVESNTEKGLTFQIIKNIMNSHEGDFQLHKRNGKCFSYKLIFKKP